MRHMNANQRNVLITVLIVVFAMTAYPPFHFHAKDIVFNLGYGWLLNPPTFNNQADPRYAGTVDLARLLTQWAGVAFAGGIGYLLLKDR
jgi:hypothetical protein